MKASSIRENVIIVLLVGAALFGLSYLYTGDSTLRTIWHTETPVGNRNIELEILEDNQFEIKYLDSDGKLVDKFSGYYSLDKDTIEFFSNSRHSSSKHLIKAEKKDLLVLQQIDHRSRITSTVCIFKNDRDPASFGTIYFSHHYNELVMFILGLCGLGSAGLFIYGLFMFITTPIRKLIKKNKKAS